jgi:hypothetical protein
MATFNIINTTTGSLKGRVTGANYQDAETKCMEKGLDMWDQYMLVSTDSKQEVIPAHPYIEEILER